MISVTVLRLEIAGFTVLMHFVFQFKEEYVS